MNMEIIVKAYENLFLKAELCITKDLKKAFFLLTMFIVIGHYYHSDVDIVFSGRMIIVTVTRSNLYYVET